MAVSRLHRKLCSVRLSDHEMEVFTAACANPENAAAQDLVNMFGADGPLDILRKMPTIPLGVLMDVVRHIWLALTFEAYRMGGDAFAWRAEDE